MGKHGTPVARTMKLLENILAIVLVQRILQNGNPSYKFNVFKCKGMWDNKPPSPFPLSITTTTTTTTIITTTITTTTTTTTTTYLPKLFSNQPFPKPKANMSERCQLFQPFTNIMENLGVLRKQNLNNSFANQGSDFESDFEDQRNPNTVNSLIKTIDVGVIVRGRYKVIRRYGLGTSHYVWKATDKTKNFALKLYLEKKLFETESHMLNELKDQGAKHIVQIKEALLPELIISFEFGLYDLETFVRYLTYNECQQEKFQIIESIIAGLEECHRADIVHTNLTPKNVMLFKNGNRKIWKLIDFDSACQVDDVVQIGSRSIHYCCPELIRAEYSRNGKPLKAHQSMDMFSFGLLLFFLETGCHYFSGVTEETLESLKSPEPLPERHEVIDVKARELIQKLLEKKKKNRMTIKQFKESEFLPQNSKRDSTGKKSSFTRTQNYAVEKLAQESQPHNSVMDMEEYKRVLMETLKKYQEDRMDRLNSIEEKIGEVLNVCKELKQLIPRWLSKLKNEKMPRIFFLLPNHPNWKNPANWLSKSFKLYFVCEHSQQMHVPKHDGYEVKQIPEFIKKYGPWIKIGLQTLSGVFRALTSNIFPGGIVEMLGSVFDIRTDCDLVKYVQQIADAMDAWNEFMPDTNPRLKASEFDSASKYQTLSIQGLKALKGYIDEMDSNHSYGGLVQGIHKETKEVVWVCEEHAHEYYGQSQKEVHIEDQQNLPHSPNSSAAGKQEQYFQHERNRRISEGLNTDWSQNQSCEVVDRYSMADHHSTMDHHSTTNHYSTIDEYSLCRHASRYSFNSVCSSVGTDFGFSTTTCTDILKNVQFLIIDIQKSANNTQHRKRYRQRINKFLETAVDNASNLQAGLIKLTEYENQHRLLPILKRYVALLLYLLRFIVRLDRTTAFLNVVNAHNVFHELHNNGLNFHKSFERIVKCLDAYQRSPTFREDPNVALYQRATSNEVNSFFEWAQNLKWENHRWLPEEFMISNYINTNKITTPDASYLRDRDGESPFRIIKKTLDKKIAVGEMSLKEATDVEELHMLEKIVYMYTKFEFNKCSNIIQFYGYSVRDEACFCLLFDWAEGGDLWTHMRKFNKVESLDSPALKWDERIRLSCEIAQAVNYLHKKSVVHLDLRASNILLVPDKTSNTIKPKLTNFIFSQHLIGERTNVRCMINNKLRKRWYDPQRLVQAQFIPDLPSDVYSLSILFWEILNGTGEIPYADVKDDRLKDHVSRGQRNKIPEVPEWAQEIKVLMNQMWRHDASERPNIEEVVSILEKIIETMTQLNTLQILQDIPRSSSPIAITSLPESQETQNILPIEEAINLFESKAYEEAFPSLLYHADRGNILACDYVGKSYQSGLGTLPEVEKAIEYFIKSSRLKQQAKVIPLTPPIPNQDEYNVLNIYGRQSTISSIDSWTSDSTLSTHEGFTDEKRVFNIDSAKIYRETRAPTQLKLDFDTAEYRSRAGRIDSAIGSPLFE
ncbi:hypothetical protein G9A89_004941 [Geosiphon pyriformis]|nr:hypothetical protein G9A89_004941 [Geosiphon pyriformis]